MKPMEALYLSYFERFGEMPNYMSVKKKYANDDFFRPLIERALKEGVPIEQLLTPEQRLQIPKEEDGSEVETYL